MNGLIKLLAIGTALVGLAGEANAVDVLKITNTSTSASKGILRLQHRNGALENPYDDFDTSKDFELSNLPPNAFEIYTLVEGSRLGLDARPQDSLTPYNINCVYKGDINQGNSVDNFLTFEFIAGGGTFGDLPLRFQETDSSGVRFGSVYDIRSIIDNQSGILNIGPRGPGSYNIDNPYKHFIFDFEPIIVEPQPKSLKVDLLRNHGGNWDLESSVVLSYSADGTDARDDASDVSLGWDGTGFSNIPLGSSVISTIGAPYGMGADRLSTDSVGLESVVDTLIEVSHNNSNFESARLAFEVLGDDVHTVDDFYFKQVLPGNFAESSASNPIKMSDILVNGTGMIEFDSWVGSFGDGGFDAQYLSGAFADFILSPDNVFTTYDDNHLVVGPGAHAVLTVRSMEDKAPRILGVPEPSTLAMLGGIALAGIGIVGYNSVRRKK